MLGGWTLLDGFYGVLDGFEVVVMMFWVVSMMLLGGWTLLLQVVAWNNSSYVSYELTLNNLCYGQIDTPMVSMNLTKMNTEEHVKTENLSQFVRD